MEKNNAIEVKNVSKQFKIFIDKGSTFKEKIIFSRRRKYEERKVLDDISFSVKKGEAIGIIGHNGCGKSTTLKLLTKIIYPDSGSIEMKGRVSSLIELGAGFHPDMSGRENIYINASIFGLTNKEIDQRIQDIIEFSELEDYIDNPVRTYSSGMYMRLAFSVSINVDADILLIDEILAVGDAHFQEKCFNKLKEIKRKGTTIVIVSHSLGQIEEICEKTIWIDNGKIKMEGIPYDVHEAYLEYMNVNKKVSEKEEKQIKKEEKKTEVKKQFEMGTATINKITAWNEKGESTEIFGNGGIAKIEMEYKVDGLADTAVCGVDIKRDHWLRCYGTDIRGGSTEEKSIEIKESDYLFYITGLQDSVENMIDDMFVNEHGEKTSEGILIRKDGIMWGPYRKAAPMTYRLLVNAEFEEEQSVILNVTAKCGEVGIAVLPLQNGKNVFELEIKEPVENMEFVIRNDSDKEIVVKEIKLV